MTVLIYFTSTNRVTLLICFDFDRRATKKLVKMKKLGIQQENVKQKRKLVTSSVVLRKLKPEEIEKFKRGRLEKCRHCPKKLKTANSLKTHMKKFHSCLGCFQPKLPKKNLCQSCHAKLNVYVSLPKISDDSGKRKSVKNDYRKFIQPDLNLVPKAEHCCTATPSKMT